jgi:hypothetical protein
MYFGKFERFFNEVLEKKEEKKPLTGLKFEKLQKSPIGNVFNAVLNDEDSEELEKIYENDKQFRQKFEEAINLVRKGYDLDEILDILDLQFSITEAENLEKVFKMLEKQEILKRI